MQSLFRKEAMQARAGLWLGSVQLKPGTSYTYLASFCAILLIGLLILLIEGTFSRKVHLQGDLVSYSGVQAGSLIFKKSPTTTVLVAHFFAPLHYIRSLSPGDQVNLSYEGFSTKDIGVSEGRVYAIAPSTNDKQSPKSDYCDVLVLLPSQKISLNGRLINLIAGMHVKASTIA